MTAGTIAPAVASAAVLGWMLYQLARRPSDPRLRAITALVACWALSWPFGLAGSGTITVLGLDAMSARAGQHILRAGAAYFLLVFFIHAARPGEQAHRLVRRQTVPLVAAVAVMAVAAAAIPPGLRDAAAALTSGTGRGPLGVDAIGAFYVAANLYMGHAFATAWYWTHRRRSQATHPLRQALAVAEAGLGAIVLATLLLVMANIVRWAGSEPPAALTLTGIALLLPGFVIFLAAVSYPALQMRLGALRRTGRQRRIWRQLRPLWSQLNAHFPDDALEPDEPLWRERIRLRGITRRYYRRFVECRDGLVRLSPYLAAVGYNAHSTPTADQVNAALNARRSDTPVADQAIAVAPPRGDATDDDVQALVQLSRQLVTHQ